MTYVEMRHSGISHDIKTEMEIIPRIGDIIDYTYEQDHHLFKVEKVIHIYENGTLDKVYISGKQIDDWLG